MEFVYDSDQNLILFSGFPCIQKTLSQSKNSTNKEQVLVTPSLFNKYFEDHAKQKQLQYVKNGLAICLTHLNRDQIIHIKKQKKFLLNLA